MSTALAVHDVLGNPLARLSAQGRPGPHDQPVHGATFARTEDGMLHPGWAAAVRLSPAWLKEASAGLEDAFPPPKCRGRKGLPTHAGGTPHSVRSSASARMTKILEAEGGAEAAARLPDENP
jgi:hypothetical protein